MQKARGKGLGHTLQWVENLFGMSIQTYLFGGALGSFNTDTAGVNQALRQIGKIVCWARVFFFTVSNCQQYMKDITVLVYIQLMVIFISTCVINIVFH